VVESGLEHITCPFCEHSVFKESSSPQNPTSELPRKFWLFYGPLFLFIFLALFALESVTGLDSLFTPPYLFFLVSLYGRCIKSVELHQEPEESSFFTCPNPACLRISCLHCKQEAHFLFDCNDPKNPQNLQKGGLEALRDHVENSMAKALMRTCPQCGLNFLKKDGCNKMSMTSFPFIYFFLSLS